ncbi:hypothetical protein AAU57_02610 [Nonlabens sp. YIK11]|nr:hypothetical protein AAU57_02610 [Nonlabens sp. YIK11]
MEVFDIAGKKNKELTSVYFKMKDWYVVSWIGTIFLAIVFIISVIGIIYSISLLYYRKKYLNLIRN